jgi:acetyl-CoA carboxylase biotin carboxylase subunit
VEFLVERDRRFWFCELNPRIQVEHTVTEQLTGIDMVEAQLTIAAGLPIPASQAKIRPRGWAFQCRITCEDPSANLLPHPGTVTDLHLPAGPGVRVDSHLVPGYDIPPYYDSLLAKLITWGLDREKARRRMVRALDEFVLEGVPAPLAFYRFIFEHPEFARGDYHTQFLGRALKEYLFYRECPMFDWNEAAYSWAE